MENKSILDYLDEQADIKSQLRLNRNKFILSMLNKIGPYLSEDFILIKEFDLDSNISSFKELFEFFISLCEKQPEKKIALQIIPLIILNTENFGIAEKTLVTDVMQIILSENFFSNKDNVTKLMNKLTNQDLILCFDQKKNIFINKINNLFKISIFDILEIMAYFFSGDSKKDLINYTVKNLKEKYKNIIVTDSIFKPLNAPNADYIHCLNQLLSLPFTDKDMKIIEYEKTQFLMREPTPDELIAYINEDSSHKPKKSKKKENPKITPENNSIEQNPSNIQQQSLSWETLDYNQLSPIKKFLFEEVKKNKDQLEKNNEQQKKTTEELQKIKEKEEKSKGEIKTLKQDLMDAKIRIGVLETDLKKIKIRSLFKGIIDVFCHTYNIGLDDYYRNKLNSLIASLDSHRYNKKAEDLKGFLMDIYSFLKGGNFLAHNIDENASPLEMVFSLLKKENKKEYPEVKTLLKELSFDGTLKYALNNYYSLKDKEKLIKNIQFSFEKLNEALTG